MVAEAPESWEPESSWGFLPLRQLHGLLPDDLYGLAGRAVQIVDWDRNHRFCGRCAAPTESVAHERAKRCPGCELVVYPRISPAVIVLVERDEKILLARAHSFSGNFYSVLAGFVEAGEALEEAVSREIAEEVGIQVQDIRYFGSQPWPFPNSLMIGFTARHAAGEIQIDEREIADAGWFRPEELPELPGKISIARRLIDAWLENR
jgi:NAD+ diphosphatase